MGKIRVTNIRVYAYHGCLSEETAIGSDYNVDVEITAELSKSARSDKLSDTVDYVLLNRIVKEEMAIPSALLETVCERILVRFFDEEALIQEATVSVSKLNPPIGGDVERVTVERTKVK
ncbi:dihydroneopterin aldolase [Dokdonia sp. Hel_I_53]|uniref:dihydroneopterin aldolase n=1 Tax=Dokdonia sp. Hel_I_53 TaxID=1566287 RepID=UPI001199292C|nr:dihydroneopterin aldolase [Dokdonia sp. Hel_I_53]TVZ52637.1 dihydroneopterin aldolase [Dokdonia sp. Hel_I_53]